MKNNTKIFAVDDEIEILQLYKEMLNPSVKEKLSFFDELSAEDKQEAFDLHTFETGEAYLEALEDLYAHDERLPVAILDMRLPGMHGFEIAKRTRQLDKDISIIIVSAYADYSVKEMLDELDENVYYKHKPFRNDELYLLISSNLKQWNTKYGELELSKELAIDSTQDGLWNWDIVTNEVYFSPQWKAMLGYEDAEISANLEEWSKRVHPDDLDAAMRDVKKHLEGKTPYYVNEHRVLCKNGEYKWILDRGKALFNSDGEAVRMTGFHTDITQRKLLEQKLLGISEQLSKELELKISTESKLSNTNKTLEKKLQKEIALREEKEEMLLRQTRHAAMGEMISMIAHQWRQPLTALGLAIDSLQIGIELESLEESELKEQLGLMHIQVQYLSQTIDDFRNFFHKNKSKETLLINECVTNALTIIQAIIAKNGINIKEEYKDTVKVSIYKSEFTQVVLNLLKNAQDTLLEREIKNPSITIRTYETQSGVVLKVIDNGGGISPSIAKKIFEPYFTTKKEQNGTGLGLYMSKMIVEDHLQGKINATNTEDGTCFSIELPKPH